MYDDFWFIAWTQSLSLISIVVLVKQPVVPSGEYLSLLKPSTLYALALVSFLDYTKFKINVSDQSLCIVILWTLGMNSHANLMLLL